MSKVTQKLKKVRITFFIVYFFGSCTTSSAFALTVPNVLNGLPITGKSPTMPFTAFDKKITGLLQRWHIPGGSVTIMRDNKILLTRGYGWADLEMRYPVYPRSLFRVASVSKAITAMTVLRLVEDGRIDLDDKVFSILNHLSPLSDDPPRSGIYKITIRNLLQMSSGWQTDSFHSPDPMFGPWTHRMVTILDYNVPPDCMSATRMMMNIPMQYIPGTRFSYSNINYCMLGLIINKITGLEGEEGYQSYVQQRILAPLGITSMRLGENHLQGRAPGEVRYYRYVPNGRTQNISGLPYSDNNILRKNYADGGWIASSMDLAKLLQGLAHNRIISPNMQKIMVQKPSFQPDNDKYFAMGWTIKSFQGHQYWLKTGSFTGTCALVVLKDDGTSYAAVFNTKPSDRGRFNKQLQNILFLSSV